MKAGQKKRRVLWNREVEAKGGRRFILKSIKERRPHGVGDQPNKRGHEKLGTRNSDGREERESEGKRLSGKSGA